MTGKIKFPLNPVRTREIIHKIRYKEIIFESFKSHEHKNFFLCFNLLFRSITYESSSETFLDQDYLEEGKMQYFPIKKIKGKYITLMIDIKGGKEQDKEMDFLELLDLFI